MTDEMRLLENTEERLEELKEKAGMPERTTINDPEVKITRHNIVCPACNQKVKAIAYDNVISGWCAISLKRITVRI